MELSLFIDIILAALFDLDVSFLEPPPQSLGLQHSLSF